MNLLGLTEKDIALSVRFYHNSRALLTLYNVESTYQFREEHLCFEFLRMYSVIK